MKCTVSQENYLKAIYLLQIQKESVRAVDVSNYMALSKPSVSNALKKLRTERLLTVDKEKNLISLHLGIKVQYGMLPAVFYSIDNQLIQNKSEPFVIRINRQFTLFRL